MSDPFLCESVLGTLLKPSPYPEGFSGGTWLATTHMVANTAFVDPTVTGPIMLGEREIPVEDWTPGVPTAKGVKKVKKDKKRKKDKESKEFEEEPEEEAGKEAEEGPKEKPNGALGNPLVAIDFALGSLGKWEPKRRKEPKGFEEGAGEEAEGQPKEKPKEPKKSKAAVPTVMRRVELAGKKSEESEESFEESSKEPVLVSKFVSGWCTKPTGAWTYDLSE